MRLDSGSLHLIPVSSPEGKQPKASDEAFEVGWCTYITRGVRIAGPVDFLVLGSDSEGQPAGSMTV